MILKPQALGGFSKFSDDELLVHASTVLQAMDGNSSYPTPTPTLAAVSDARDDFASRLALARKRSGPEETSAKKDAREALAELMKQLAFYVSSTAKGNLTALLSSGFRTSAYPQQGRVPERPFGAKLVHGRQSGHFGVQYAKGAGQALLRVPFRNTRDGRIGARLGRHLCNHLFHRQYNNPSYPRSALLYTSKSL